jgi:TolA-binding protein
MTRACTLPNLPVRLKVGLVLAALAGPAFLGAMETPAPQADLAVPATPATTSAALSIAAKRSDEIRGIINVGKNMTERGDYIGAEIAFRQVLNAPDASPAGLKQALLALAHMHRRQGALTKAAAIYEKYLKDYPGDDLAPDALLELGRCLRDMGAYTTAIARFYSVINSTLKLPAGEFTHYQQLAKTAQFEIAETHFEAGEFVEASKFFLRLRLLDLAPADRAHAHFMAAYSLSLQGHDSAEDTVKMLEEFIEEWPTDENIPEARYLLATSLHSLNRTQEAFAATLQLLQAEKSQVAANPKRWAYWQRRTGNQLANDFFENGDIINAQEIYAGLAALSDDPAWQLPATYQLALCYDRLGAGDQARVAYQKVVDGVAGSAANNLVELKRLATWRLGQLDWHDGISHQVTALLDTRTGRLASPAAAKTN